MLTNLDLNFKDSFKKSEMPRWGPSPQERAVAAMPVETATPHLPGSALSRELRPTPEAPNLARRATGTLKNPESLALLVLFVVSKAGEHLCGPSAS